MRSHCQTTESFAKRLAPEEMVRETDQADQEKQRAMIYAEVHQTLQSTTVELLFYWRVQEAAEKKFSDSVENSIIQI